MRLENSITVIGCTDVDASLEFYRHALQFVVLKKRDGPAGLEWVYMRSGDTLLMLEKTAVPSTASVHCNTRIYLFCDDVDGMRHLLKARGVNVSEMRVTPYMKEFDLYDPGGQRLSIGQPVKEKTGNRD